MLASGTELVFQVNEERLPAGDVPGNGKERAAQIAIADFGDVVGFPVGLPRLITGSVEPGQFNPFFRIAILVGIANFGDKFRHADRADPLNGEQIDPLGSHAAESPSCDPVPRLNYRATQAA